MSRKINKYKACDPIRNVYQDTLKGQLQNPEEPEEK